MKPEFEVDNELRFHIERRIQDYIARGMSPDAARRAALARFGDIEAVRQICARLLTQERKAEARRDWLDDLRQDVRFAISFNMRALLFSYAAGLTRVLRI